MVQIHKESIYSMSLCFVEINQEIFLKWNEHLKHKNRKMGIVLLINPLCLYSSLCSGSSIIILLTSMALARLDNHFQQLNNKGTAKTIFNNWAYCMSKEEDLD